MMGRSREYDEDAVLKGAMHAFRHHGYHAVSIKDLVEATGLKSGSIYNSYHDKAGLFEAAFAHYNRTVLCRRIVDHAPKSAGLDGVRNLFLSLLREPNGEFFGCLITNTAVEFGGGAPLPTGVGEGLRILADALNDRLVTAHRAGELRADMEPTTGALKLLALYQGVLVLVRAGAEKAALEALINEEFTCMTGEPQ